MKNISHKKSCNTGAVQIHVETSPIPLIKIKNDVELENDCVKIKLCRDPTSENRIYMNSKWPCLETASQSISSCSCGTSK